MIDFDLHFRALVERGDFGLFERLASEVAQSEEPRAGWSALEKLLAEASGALAAKPGGQDGRKAIGEAITSYVDFVWPHRCDAGLGKGDAQTLAEKYGVVRDHLPSRITRAFEAQWVTQNEQDGGADETAATTQPDEPEPAADNTAQTDRQGDAQTTPRKEQNVIRPRFTFQRPRTEYQTPSSELDEICLFARDAMARKEPIIVLLGLATAGKTFLVRRLAAANTGYAALDINGQDITTGDLTDRTQGVVIYTLRTGDKKKTDFTIFDLPGEYFRAFSDGDKDIDAAQREKMCAVMAAADMCIIVEPAIQIFASEKYKQTGDCTTPGRIRDELMQVLAQEDDRGRRCQAEGKPFVPRDFEDMDAEAQQQAYYGRHTTILDLKKIVSQMEAVRQRILYLRSSVRQLIGAGLDPKAKPAAKDAPTMESDEVRKARQAQDKAQIELIEKAIRNYLEIPFRELPKAADPLPIPGLLLFSRTDDFLRRTSLQPNPCEDPAGALARHDPQRSKIYSSTFSLFSVDFISASIPPDEYDGDTRDFDPKWDHQGVAGLLEDWILPAIRFSQGRSAAKGRAAYAWRKLFDRGFAREGRGA